MIMITGSRKPEVPGTIMKFPYGLSNFGKLIQEGYWYQDCTDELRGFTEPRSKRS